MRKTVLYFVGVLLLNIKVKYCGVSISHLLYISPLCFYCIHYFRSSNVQRVKNIKIKYRLHRKTSKTNLTKIADSDSMLKKQHSTTNKIFSTSMNTLILKWKFRFSRYLTQCHISTLNIRINMMHACGREKKNKSEHRIVVQFNVSQKKMCIFFHFFCVHLFVLYKLYTKRWAIEEEMVFEKHQQHPC